MNLCQPYYIEKRSDSKHFSLNGEWSFCWKDVRQDNIENIAFEYKTQLPSDVYFSLYNAGVLPHPYKELNSKQYRWVDEKIWYYRRTFSLDKPNFEGNAYLCFDGISYYSRVWVNGELLGEHEGMFGGPIADVADMLNLSGENEIIVEVTPALFGWDKGDYQSYRLDDPATQIIPWATVRNSATAEYVLVGIWNNIRIEFLDKIHLSRPSMKTSQIEKNFAYADFEVEIITPEFAEIHGPYGNENCDNAYTWAFADGVTGIVKDETVFIEITVTEKNTQRVVYNSNDEINLLDYEKQLTDPAYYENQFFKKSILIPEPKLWFPTGLGEPYLYTVRVELKMHDTVLDTLQFNYGIRMLSTDYTKGRKYRGRMEKYKFSINGKDFFLKGMNWMPLDQLYNFKREEYKWALSLAKNAGIQLLRVWNGGGIPETDDFYELCDELGIMVWQDHFIANTSNTAGYSKRVLESQSAMNLYRIRNHPSLVIHCGGNEFGPYKENNAATMFTMLDVIRELDSDKTVYYATPDGGSAHIYRDLEPVWYRHLYQQLPFVGESGIHCFPNFKSIQEMICEEETKTVLTPLDTEAFKDDFPQIVNHFIEYNPFAAPRLLSRVSQVTDLTKADLKAYCEASQVQAYEFYQIMIQSMLENYPVCGGIMPWVFKRPFTHIAIQTVDGAGRPVLPYYAIKNTYLPVSAFLQLDWNLLYPGECVPLKVFVSDTINSDLFGATVSLSIYDSSLNRVFEKHRCVEPNKKHFDFGSFTLDDRFTDTCFLINVRLTKKGSIISDNTYSPRCLSMLSNPEVLKKHRSSPQKCMNVTEGPFIKDTFVAAPKGALKATAKHICKDTQGYRRIEVCVQNIGNTPVYPVTVDIYGDNRFFADDNFFLLKPDEQRSFTITTDSAESKLKIILSGWNCDDICCDVQP